MLIFLGGGQLITGFRRMFGDGESENKREVEKKSEREVRKK